MTVCRIEAHLIARMLWADPQTVDGFDALGRCEKVNRIRYIVHLKQELPRQTRHQVGRNCLR